MRSAWLCFAFLVAACSLETKGRGEKCQRTAQCALGLACVAARCTTDLRAVAEQNTVPNLNAGAGASGAAAGENGGAGAAGGEP